MVVHITMHMFSNTSNDLKVSKERGDYWSQTEYFHEIKSYSEKGML